MGVRWAWRIRGCFRRVGCWLFGGTVAFITLLDAFLLVTLWILYWFGSLWPSCTSLSIISINDVLIVVVAISPSFRIEQHPIWYHSDPTIHFAKESQTSHDLDFRWAWIFENTNWEDMISYRRKVFFQVELNYYSSYWCKILTTNLSLMFVMSKIKKIYLVVRVDLVGFRRGERDFILSFC